ncbi:MAG: nitrate/nitrite transporter, partial [Oleiphilaceae bacterium]|nr:nitrate/nitrite transporter [Oleiphilaceae bacterium]
GDAGVIFFLPGNLTAGSFWGFFVCFLVLFIGTGIGNGSTFRMVPVIFRNLLLKEYGEARKDEVQKSANKEAAAVLGFISAIAAYGGFFIPKAYGTSIAASGSVVPALIGFIIFYASCMVVTWYFYARKGAPAPC